MHANQAARISIDVASGANKYLYHWQCELGRYSEASQSQSVDTSLHACNCWQNMCCSKKRNDPEEVPPQGRLGKLIRFWLRKPYHDES